MGVRRLPNDHVAHQGCHCGQVAGDGCEVEWGDCEHKPFKWSVFQSVPNAIGALGLLGMDFLCVVRVETEEVCEFTSRIDFSLETVFALGKHGGCVDFGPVGPCHQVCSLQENSCAVFPPQARPSCFRTQCCVNRHSDMGFRPIAEVTKHFAVFMGRCHWALVFGRDALVTDVHGNLDGVLVVHRLVRSQKGFAFWGARRVAEHGFV